MFAARPTHRAIERLHEGDLFGVKPEEIATIAILPKVDVIIRLPDVGFKTNCDLEKMLAMLFSTGWVSAQT